MLNDLPAKEWIGAISIAVGAIGYIPALVGLYRRTFKPHVFTWMLCGLLMGIVFAGQWSDGGGAGMWVTGFSALMCSGIATAAYFLRHEIDITKSDWITFMLGLLTIPLWALTDTPLWSMLLIIPIEALAFWPTARKSWHQPQSESPLTYLIATLKFAIAIPALENFSWITLSYPVALVILHGAIIGIIMLRRYQITGRLNWN